MDKRPNVSAALLEPSDYPLHPAGSKIGDRLSPSMLRSLQGAACIVILMWGIRTASHLLVLLLMALLLAYAFVTLPKWFMQKFGLQRSAALGLTMALFGTLSLVTVVLLYEEAVRIREKLPIYQAHFMTLYEQIGGFTNAHGIDFAGISAAKLSTSDKILEFARAVLPEAGGLLVNGLLISALALILLIKMAEQAGANRDPLTEKLEYYGADVQRYIAISAKTGLITAVANLLLLVAVGVDFPVVWCVLYFFLHFIPNVGFILALIPPVLLALLMLSWQRALLVGGGLILAQLLTDYVLTPILMKKAVHVSFLEIMLSIMFWGFLLGPAGAILAIPLTLSLRKFMERFSSEEELASATSG